MEVEIIDEELIYELTSRLKDECYCGFRGLKPELEELKQILETRWNEPIDLHCIE